MGKVDENGMIKREYEITTITGKK